MFPYGIAVIVFLLGLFLVWEAVTWASMDPRGYAKPSQCPVLWWGGLGIMFAGIGSGTARWLGYLSVALLALAIGITSSVSPALAADGATVSIPIGDWISAGLGDLASLLLAVASFVVAKWAPPLVKTFLTEQLLQRAVDYAIAAVEGAAKGKTLTVPVANEVLAEAANYAVDHAPGTAKWLGDTLRPKLIARLGAAGVLPDDAHAGNLTG